ncbi:hypothetical protein CYQ88_08425 [Hydrogenovibrio sp. SC-1]|uniref:hypothetical protein n=1 Tax=Hydrogenovibrio sp. SC-1 TaxID=2065820 RepID=UPI000C7DA55E|nr:hypothetical protein [Hydrogenovibrio sp. SC-1]PLA73980.1 hypothetical protein CYQ88_08425 [Hydrogenovibrio sp. SC-1]
MIKVMNIFDAKNDKFIDVSHRGHDFGSFVMLADKVLEVINSEIEIDCRKKWGVSSFFTDPFIPVRYVLDDEVVANQAECQLEVCITSNQGDDVLEFRFDVAANNQTDIDEAREYEKGFSWACQVNFSKTVHISEGKIPKFIA